VIPESLQKEMQKRERYMQLFLIILSIAVIIFSVFGTYVFFRIEAGHYPSKILTALQRIAGSR